MGLIIEHKTDTNNQDNPTFSICKERYDKCRIGECLRGVKRVLLLFAKI